MAWIDLAGKKRGKPDAAMLGDSGFTRVNGDRYWTEPWCTEALLNKIQFRGRVWEPAAGRGDMVNVLLAHGYDVAASDIAGDSLGCVGSTQLDFLSVPAIESTKPFSIVTNPPYVHAEAFLRKAIELTKPSNGMVAMLFRNEYDCAASRRDIFENPPFMLKLILTRRPRWDDAAGQRSASPRHNFSWFMFDWLHKGPATMVWGP